MTQMVAECRQRPVERGSDDFYTDTLDCNGPADLIMETLEHPRRFGEGPNGDLTISFFSAPASQVARTLVAWGRQVWRKSTVCSPIPGTWYEFLGEYVTPDNRLILAPTRGEWSAFINNDRIGGMPFSELVVIPERLRERSASFVIRDLQKCRTEKRPYAAMFNFCDATRGEAVQRYVGLTWDGGNWEYHEHGSPLPFEDVEAYTRRKKADRLTPEMLVRYARALGIHLDEGDSYYDLSQGIGIKWGWDQTGGIQQAEGVLRNIGERMNRQLGVKWIFDLFRK